MGLGARGWGLAVAATAIALSRSPGPNVVSGFSGTVVAQNPQPETPPQPTFRTEANYVRVDVFPTKGGVPVADLTQDDFEVLEDRVTQRIEQFEHVVIRGNLPQDMRAEPNT